MSTLRYITKQSIYWKRRLVPLSKTSSLFLHHSCKFQNISFNKVDKNSNTKNSISFIHSSTCYMKKDENNRTNSHNHSLFEEQMKELQEETSFYTGSKGSTKNGLDDTHMKESTSYEKQIQEMKEEREALYNFTKDEKNAWTDLDPNKKVTTYTQSFFDQLEQARAIQDQEEERTMESTTENNESNQLFTHLTNKNDDPNEELDIHMVDVGHKKVTRRVAHARSRVIFPQSVMDAFLVNTSKTSNKNDKSSHELIGPKGPIFATAKLAGIMGAKKTSDLIPLCHPLPIDQITIQINLCPNTNTATIDCKCTVTHKTGVEMEAMVGASVAALTIYDMVKAVSHEVQIEQVSLIEKKGGKRLVKDGILV